MEQLSGYEIAQKRIEGRQQKRTRLGLWIAMFILSAALFALGGVGTGGCAVPAMVTFGFFAIMDGIQWYFASSHGAPSQEMVADEMGWLFGDDWRELAGTQEFMLAQERIRRRRIRRAYFYLHVFGFLMVNALLLYLTIDTFTRAGPSSIRWMILFPGAWLTLLAGHATRVFSSRQRLERQERKIGQAILVEMQRSVPDLEKRKDKPKRDAQYRLGEDGELVEIEDEFTFDDDEKPKRSSLE